MRASLFLVVAFAPRSSAENATVYIQPDEYGDEICWEISNPADDAVLASGGPYANEDTSPKFVEVDLPQLSPEECYTFSIYDSEALGHYQVDYNGTNFSSVFPSFPNGRWEHTYFGSSHCTNLSDPPAQGPPISSCVTNSPTFSPTTTPVIANITIQPDCCPGEISWEIKDFTGSILASGSGDENDTLYLPEIGLEQCYTFTIYDSAGDGLCCDHGIGYYELIAYNETTIVNSSFRDARMEYKHFGSDYCTNLPITSAPTLPTTDMPTSKPTTTPPCEGEELVAESQGCHSAEVCRDTAQSLGLIVGHPVFGYEGNWSLKGCFYYPNSHPEFPNRVFFGSQGTCEELGAAPNDGIVRINCWNSTIPEINEFTQAVATGDPSLAPSSTPTLSSTELTESVKGSVTFDSTLEDEDDSLNIWVAILVFTILLLLILCSLNCGYKRGYLEADKFVDSKKVAQDFRKEMMDSNFLILTFERGCFTRWFSCCFRDKSLMLPEETQRKALFFTTRIKRRWNPAMAFLQLLFGWVTLISTIIAVIDPSITINLIVGSCIMFMDELLLHLWYGYLRYPNPITQCCRNRKKEKQDKSVFGKMRRLFSILYHGGDTEDKYSKYIDVVGFPFVLIQHVGTLTACIVLSVGPRRIRRMLSGEQDEAEEEEEEVEEEEAEEPPQETEEHQEGEAVDEEAPLEELDEGLEGGEENGEDEEETIKKEKDLQLLVPAAALIGVLTGSLAFPIIFIITTSAYGKALVSLAHFIEKEYYEAKLFRKSLVEFLTGILCKAFTDFVGVQDFGTENDGFVDFLKHVVKWKYELEILDTEDLDDASQALANTTKGGLLVNSAGGSNRSVTHSPTERDETERQPDQTLTKAPAPTREAPGVMPPASESTTPAQTAEPATCLSNDMDRPDQPSTIVPFESPTAEESPAPDSTKDPPHTAEPADFPFSLVPYEQEDRLIAVCKCHNQEICEECCSDYSLMNELAGSSDYLDVKDQPAPRLEVTAEVVGDFVQKLPTPSNPTNQELSARAHDLAAGLVQDSSRTQHEIVERMACVCFIKRNSSPLEIRNDFSPAVDKATQSLVEAMEATRHS
ncbi:endonuclease I [Seminavis robusta]|uniref:Endonuclease I n=1 Tax=Seminavis robusta TaxID=568900 RepID=A0A9N8F0N4_9STRA|nr:endonuclease I [Seminavis robusta]|eukprot:Sro2238_g320210.1 endonuclease I (1085) ;mRNA; f:9609-13089